MLIAIRDFLPSSFISSPSDLEIVSIKIGQGYGLVFCCIYVPPESSLSYISSLVHFLTDLSSSFSKIIIVGDFNFPGLHLWVPQFHPTVFVVLFLIVI